MAIVKKIKPPFKNILPFVFIACQLIAIVSCSTQPPATDLSATKTAESKPTNVIRKGTFEKRSGVTGYVMSLNSQTYLWKTSGIVKSVEVQLGEKVEKGQLLSALDPSTLSSSVLDAEVTTLSTMDEIDKLLVSEVAKAKAYKEMRDKEAELNKAERKRESMDYPIANEAQIKEAEFAMNQAKEKLGLAEDDLEGVRLRDHLDQERNQKYGTYLSALNTYAKAYDLWQYYIHNVPQSEKEIATAAIREAETAYQTALSLFKTYQKSFVREKDLKELEIKLDNARKIATSHELFSNIDGTVTLISSRAGDYVASGTTAIRIDDMQSLYIDVQLSEVDIHSLKDGMKTVITLDAIPEKQFTGVVRNVSSSGLSQTDQPSFQTVIQLDGVSENDGIKIGMTAVIDILQRQKENVLLAPVTALVREGMTTSLLINKNGVISKVPVVVGDDNGAEIEILSGNVQEGDQLSLPTKNK